jgi:hypothetical protein
MGLKISLSLGNFQFYSNSSNRAYEIKGCECIPVGFSEKIVGFSHNLLVIKNDNDHHHLRGWQNLSPRLSSRGMMAVIEGDDGYHRRGWQTSSKGMTDSEKEPSVIEGNDEWQSIKSIFACCESYVKPDDTLFTSLIYESVPGNFRYWYDE